MSWSDIGEAFLPWWATGSGLGANETAELSKKRSQAATIDTPQQQTTKDPAMAGKAIVDGAKRAIDLVRNNPAAAAKLQEYYAKATGKSVDFTSADAVNIPSKGPAPAAVVLKGAVRAGVNPDHIFDTIMIERADNASLQIISELRKSFGALTSNLDGAAAIHSPSSFADRVLHRELIQYARQASWGGSKQAIRENHAKLRAFLQMDTQALEEGLALYF